MSNELHSVSDRAEQRANGTVSVEHQITLHYSDTNCATGDPITVDIGEIVEVIAWTAS